MENTINRYLVFSVWFTSFVMLFLTCFPKWQQPDYWQYWQPSTADLLFCLWVLLFVDVMLTIKKTKKLEHELADLKIENSWLKENRNFEGSLGNNPDEVVWVADLKTRKVSYFEGFIEKMFGYTLEDVTTTKGWWERNLHPLDRDTTIEKFEAAMRNNEKFCQAEYRFLCKDGTYKYILDSSYIVRGRNGEAKRIIGSMVDISNYKELQANIEQQKAIHEAEVRRIITETQNLERHRLSSELHDNINQLMLSARLFANYGAAHWNLKPDEKKLLDNISETITEAFEEIRNLSHRLHSSWTKKHNLIVAVNELCARMERSNHFQIKVDVSGFDPDVLSIQQRYNIYRIIQEQLSNIIKHANASLVTVRLSRMNDMTELEIIDNGKGFDLKTADRGIGLMNMQHRAESSQGEIHIQSAIGTGTHLKALFRPALSEQDDEYSLATSTI